MAATIRLHIIGHSSGKGESIILFLPDGKVGVIDSYSMAGSVPAIDVLREHNVEELAFVGLTHPHRDHYMGLAKILESFPVKEYWHYGGLGQPDILRIVLMGMEEETAFSNSTTVDQLVKIHETVQGKGKQGKRAKIHPVPIGARVNLYTSKVDDRHQCQIWGLAPSGRQQMMYQERLRSAFYPPDFRELRKDLVKVNHNIISGAFLITFGDARVVLGGDAERGAWSDALNDHQKEDLNSVHVVKVSHHGSTNGFCANLWECFSEKRKPLAVVTPYIDQGLPDSEALDHISNHSESVVATSGGHEDFNGRAEMKHLMDMAAEFGHSDKIAVGLKSHSAEEWEWGMCTIEIDSAGKYSMNGNQFCQALPKK